MIKIENAEVFGWDAAIRGMRNPMNSWHKSDSFYNCAIDVIDGTPNYCVGEEDLNLMRKLTKSGDDHGKFLRMINVTCDIVAPLYWWKEFDTYKVGTVANSCSTMHKIHAKKFTLDDFSCENIGTGYAHEVLHRVIDSLNISRQLFIETKDKQYWWEIIQLLPSSYNQRRTVQLNYQVLKNMYNSRCNHKLDEWMMFCKWMIEELPYFNCICI